MTALKSIFYSSLLLVFLTISSPAQEMEFAPNSPVPEIKLTLSPNKNNPRNSEGDFIALDDGSILFIYSHYYGASSSDHASAYLASRVSMDQGRSWSEIDKIELPNEGGMNVMSVSLLRLQNGQIALFYLRKNSTSDCIPMLRLSTNEAQSWGEAIPCITDRAGYFVLNNDRVIQLPNGRIMFAVAQHNELGGIFSRKGDVYVYYSDNNGHNWKSSMMIPNPDSITFQEPGIVLLKNGSLLMFIRSDAGSQCFSKSTDGGIHWSTPVRSQLISPLSPATIERIPETGDLIAVWNNNLSTNVTVSKYRTPLNISISQDEGVSWQNIKILEHSPDGWYCYTAMHFTAKGILLGYCAGKRQENGLGTTIVKSVDLDWIYEQ